MTREILIDILNICKIVYKNGISGTLILGENLNKIFTALPEHYSFTDFDVHIIDSSEIQKELETIKQLSMDFTKNGLVDPEIILEMITSNGLTKMKSDVMKALNKKKNENNQLGQLDQQVKQLDSELKEVSGEAQKLQKEVQRLSAEKLQLEKERLAYEKELEWYKARSDNRFKEKTLEANMKRVELEGLQLLDENKRNDEIRDN
jgi:predicted  nucleic acid-binding Zn-ribbon protein